MNTGIMDAHNLAWKLALVADGGASDELLNTYEQERRPVAGNVLGLSDAIVRWHHMNHPVKRAFRDALVPAITRLPAVQGRATGHPAAVADLRRVPLESAQPARSRASRT
jgi:2-polyprenyl-6-methoxyphenol hydroxylase-like FAD-dependent oxidoreductase